MRPRGLGEAALRHASRYRELVEAHADQMADWDLAFACDALARALRGQRRDRSSPSGQGGGRISGEAIADEEDRVYFMRWLEGGNWHGLQERR